MLPFGKRGHIVLYLSVYLSVGRSVEQAMSAQYIFPLSLKVAKLGTVDATKV